VNETGASAPCIMVPGNPYVACVDGCEFERCPDEESQRNCGDMTTYPTEENRTACVRERAVKWCRKYERREASEDGEPLGFVPRMTHCMGTNGVVSQTPGRIVKKGTDKLGNCYYRDGVTMVERNETGPYAQCGENGEICSDTFAGAYLHRDYDPRWRTWYEKTKEIQRNNWSPPYPFFTNLEMGITYSEPIYSTIEGKNVFAGVVAVDYTFENITEFLIKNYLNSSTAVAIFEDDEPNNMIGSSTGSKAARKVLRSDKSQPCPDVNRDTCTADRIKMSDLGAISGVPIDAVLSEAFERQKAADFPPAELVTVKVTYDQSASGRSEVYVSQTQPFELPDAKLTWRIMIVSPTSLSEDDAILPGDSLFGFMIGVGVAGFAVCLTFFYMYYKRRHLRAIVVSDWRFTGAFLLGCALLNTATFTSLGPNTDGTCMLRMWVFHLLFATTFSPLLVKTWRMWKLAEGGRTYTRVIISHQQAFFMCFPIPLAQLFILVTFSAIDPYRQADIIENSGPGVTHRFICSHDTLAFLITELIFGGGVVLLGCILAFKTRNLRGNFGEAKQLIICMYDIALVGSVTVIVTMVMGAGANGTGQASERMLKAVGAFWVTTFSCCAFVVPRLIQARDDASRAGRTRAMGMANGILLRGHHGGRAQASQVSVGRPLGSLSVISETCADRGEDRTSGGRSMAGGTAPESSRVVVVAKGTRPSESESECESAPPTMGAAERAVKFQDEG